ncbi:MAG TPA: NADP-dependent malic enzyme [Caldisericia bacterium]|nr:NADP-dependent malic enzyme [Caldisericia bacterium]HPF49161.1 NADP-dependent malic enzyme [Caldisericia bacterium]HPI82975.1 NADP-dependent malic enzyme [Caldisericia bacterium]HPQ92202.1 NADP-dependent malic enzyme [Caldisericia bacterium]HRV74700.1 NADP-dependent malic enzyme [Caldisericia bacterium]
MKRFDIYDEEALELHKKYRGKIDIGVKADLRSKHALSVWYTPGVAHPCRIINKNPETVYDYTIKSNTLAVATDGSRVLGLGNIGPEASIPVMEGKAALFVEFGGIDAFPLPIKARTVEEFVATVKAVEPMFGGINLEDISIPQCFDIEEALIRELDIPVFHDDQHGTAVVTLAGLRNALKLLNKKPENQKVIISGAGASGSAIAKLLISAGFGDVILCDRAGALYEGRTSHMYPYKEQLAKISNKDNVKGTLEEMLRGADILIGVACPGLIEGSYISSMNKDPIVFPLANPDPDIDPDIAKEYGAAIVGTGRSDLPNQINNLCAFPGIMRGALDSRARVVNEAMKMAAADAIAGLMPEDKLAAENIIVEPFTKGLAQTVGKAVAKAAFDSGVARTKLTLEQVCEMIDERLKGK